MGVKNRLTMFVFLLFACAHSTVVWESTPVAAMSVPTTDVSVVAADSRCQSMADELALSVAANGLTVTPNSRSRLLLNLCSMHVRTEMDVSTVEGGAGGTAMQPLQMLRGTGEAALTLEVDGMPKGMVGSTGSRVRAVKGGDSDALLVKRRIRERVLRDVVEGLMVQLWPESETKRRPWFDEPPKGSWKAAHNQAVSAERAGRCRDAVQFAEQAVQRSGRLASAQYLTELRAVCPPE